MMVMMTMMVVMMMIRLEMMITTMMEVISADDGDDVFGWLCNSWTTVDVIVRYEWR